MADENKKMNNDVQVPEVAEEITVSAVSGDTKKSNKGGFFKSRSFKYGTMATAITAALIIVVIAANMVFSVLTDSYSWALDFTSTGMYEISDASRQVVDSLKEDVKIEVTVFFDETKYPYYCSEPIKRFCNLSDQITYTYIDPEKNPSALKQYGSEYNVQEAAVVVKSGDRVRVFNYNDYFQLDDETGSMHIYLEEKLAAGVLFVTKEVIPVVYFLNGHGEEGYESFKNLFANNGVDVKEINLMTDAVEFDHRSKLMVICNPTRDYSDTEIRIIDDFLNNDNNYGRNVMYFSSTEAEELPNIEEYLKIWGIEFNDDLVLDSQYRVGNYPYLVIPEFTTETIMNTGATVSTVTSPIISYSRSIKRLFEENSIYKTQSLINSIDETSYSKSTDAVTSTWDKEENDKSGPFDLSVLSMKYTYRNNVQVQSYLLATASSDMLTEEYLTYTGNGEYLMQLYKLMANEKDDTILAAQKSSSSTVAVIDGTQTNVMTAVVLGIIPCIFLIVGLIVYIRRRFL